MPTTFDRWTRTLTQSRRGMLVGLIASVTGGLGASRTMAKKKRKQKHKRKHKKRKPELPIEPTLQEPTPQPNAFGCLDVGQPCQGDSTTCCSGLCEGGRPHEGEQDASRCIAHDTSICIADFDLCTSGQNAICNINNPNCQCLRTTGNAGFCGDVSLGLLNLCHDCRRDMDCVAEFGVGAACVAYGGICQSICPGTAGTACVPACKAVVM